MYMEAIKVINLEGKPDLWLPPGFRFHPTDDELVSFYLTGKILNSSFAAHAIAEVDLNKYEPWDLPEKANIGEKDQWYFFTLRDRKYPTGMRTNRATVAGYWKATGKDRDVISSRTSCLVGMKKTLVFYKGRAPRGEKTNWIMHEYRLEGKTGALSRIETTSPKEWVVCRVFQKKAGAKKHMALQTEKDVSYSDSEPPSPVADEAHLKPTENTDTNNEVDWYNDQVSCITRNQCEDFENREYFAPGNACIRRGNKTSFVGPPADNPSSTRAAIMKNSLYTNTLANESLSITAKIPILAREHTSSQYSVPLSSSAVNTLIKTCKVEPSYSNLTVDHSLPVTTPPITEILSSWMGENMAMDYDNLDIRQLLPLQLLPPIESGIAADHCRMCIDHENPSTSHRFLQYHLDPSSAMIQLEQ